MSVMDFIAIMGYSITVFMFGYMVGNQYKKDRHTSK